MMNVYIALGATYLVVWFVVAVRFYSYARKNLDEYEWLHNSRHHKSTLFWCPMFWPVLLLKPSQIIKPHKLFIVRWSLATAHRETDHLRSSPPACGRYIKYKPDSCYEDCYGEFVMASADIEEALKHKLILHPNLITTDEGDVFDWVKSRDQSIEEPQLVPSAWGRFQYLADELVRKGKVTEVRCTECGALSTGQIKILNDSEKFGWNFDRLTCPQGHVLLLTETVHLQSSKDRA